MSVTLDNWQGYSQMDYGLGPRQTPLDITYVHIREGTSVSTLIRSYVSSWVNACGEITRGPTMTIWSTFAIILGSPSASKSSANPIALEICMTYQSASLHLWWRTCTLRQLIGQYATINSRSVKIVFQLRTDFPQPCRISRKKIKRTIAPWSMNICVTSCLQLRLNTKRKGQKYRSIRLTLIECPLYLTATSPSGLRGIRSQGPVSCSPTGDPRKSRRIAAVPSATVCFSRRKEFLSGSICRIVPRNVQSRVPDSPSRMEW